MSIKSIFRYFVPLVLFAVGLPLMAIAQPADTLEVQFRVGQSDLDLRFADNEQHIHDFLEYVKKNFAEVAPIDMSLTIYAGASPEGPSELNRRLGEQRGISLRDVLLQHLDGRIKNIAVVNQGARWGALYNNVEKSNESWREDVLRILEKHPEKDTWKIDPREQQLRKLKNGRVWRELNERYLPSLRSSGSAIVAKMTEPLPPQRDTLVIYDTIVYVPEPCPEPFIDHRPYWAVKTNLLLWGVIAPNVQLEAPVGESNRWSIEGEFFLPWWTWSHNANAEQFFNLGVELRYWLGDRQRHHTLDGWHIGAGLAGVYYDFEWKRHEGWQGEYLNIYCNIGYQHRFGRRNQWLVDGGLGLGYIPTKFRHYLGSSIFPEGHEEQYDDHLMWQNNGWRHILGATHVNVTLGYLFDAKDLYQKIKKLR